MKKDIFAVLLLLLLLIIFFWKAVTLQGMFYGGDIAASDISEFFYPIRVFAAESLIKGNIPLWSPYTYCGFPFLAEGTAGVFYPFYFLFYLFLPPYAAFNYCTILPFFMAGLFTYIFARSISQDRYSAVISSVIFMFCGFFVSHLKHLSLIAAACWLPLELYFTEMLFQKKGAIYAFFLGIIIALQIFSGHLQFTFNSMLGVSFYFIFRLIVSCRSGKETQINLKKATALFLLAVSIGIGLGAVQLAPTYELTRFSERASGISYEKITQCSYHPKDLITLIFPYYYGNPANASYQTKNDEIFWEKCAYAGIIPLLLVLISLFRIRSNKYYAVFFGMMIFFLLLSMGRYTPLYPFLFNFPGFAFFRIPSRFLFLFDFSLAILSGMAVNCWPYRDKVSPVLFKTLTAVLIFAIIADLFLFGINHNPVISFEKWFKKPKTVKFLEKDNDLFRIHSMGGYQSWPIVYKYLAKGWEGDLTPYVNHREILQPNSNIPHHILDAYGYSPLALERINNLFGRADNIYINETYPPREMNKSYNPNWLKIFGLLNVKYIVTLFDLPPYDLRLRMQTNLNWRFNQVKIYQNKYFMPRAFLVPSSRFIREENAILTKMFSPDYEPSKEVIIEKNINWGSSSIKGSNVEIKSYLPMEVCLNANLTDKGFLVLSDTYYPGWKVFIDGREGEILQANYVMRAVDINKGRHSVRFVYDPLSFKIGAGISLAILLITAGFTIWNLKSK